MFGHKFIKNAFVKSGRSPVLYLVVKLHRFALHNVIISFIPFLQKACQMFEHFIIYWFLKLSQIGKKFVYLLIIWEIIQYANDNDCIIHRFCRDASKIISLNNILSFLFSVMCFIKFVIKFGYVLLNPLITDTVSYKEFYRSIKIF